MHDENTHGEVCYSNVEEVFDYVDFHGVNNILSSSPNLMKILMFTRETMIDPFFNTLMACEEKIIHEKQLIFKVSHSNGQSFQYNHHCLVIIRRTLLIVEYHLVLIMRREEWIELIVHPKDRGKKKMDLRASLHQPGEYDMGVSSKSPLTMTQASTQLKSTSPIECECPNCRNPDLNTWILKYIMSIDSFIILSTSLSQT